MKVHEFDQFFRVVERTGETVLDGVHMVNSTGFAVLIHAGTIYSIINVNKVSFSNVCSSLNHRNKKALSGIIKMVK